MKFFAFLKNSPDDYNAPVESSTSQAAQQRSITIDRSNEEDFPSLAGSSGGPSMPLVPATFTRLRSGASGLARTKENFPALGAGGGGGIIIIIIFYYDVSILMVD